MWVVFLILHMTRFKKIKLKLLLSFTVVKKKCSLFMTCRSSEVFICHYSGSGINGVSTAAEVSIHFSFFMRIE